MIGGRAPGRWAKENWGGTVDEILLLELPIAGPLPQLRITGTIAGLNEVLPGIEKSSVVRLDGNGGSSRHGHGQRAAIRRRN